VSSGHRRGRISIRDEQRRCAGAQSRPASALAVAGRQHAVRDRHRYCRTVERYTGSAVSGFNSPDRDGPTAPDTDGSADADEDAETMDLADAMGAPDADDETRESDRSAPYYCAACGDPTRSSALTRLAVHDDSGVSHTALCRDCANDAAHPPACALCRSTGSERYAVTYVRNGEQFGTVCATCRTGLCAGAAEDG
jgi:hypothetical protein